MEQRPFNRHEREPSERDEVETPRLQRFQFGPWLFNVNAARAIIAESPRETQALPVAAWAQFYGLGDAETEGVSLFAATHLDRDYAMTTNLAEPVLVATIRSSEHRTRPLLIDGTHRLYRAHIERVAELPAYVLSVEESLAIREDGFIGGSVYWPSHDAGREMGQEDV